MSKMHHPPQDMQLHAEFYSKWQRPNGGGSCCSEKDCYPTKARFNSAKGVWEAERREDKRWLIIPKSIYDSSKPQSPESPDGRSHLCAPSPTSEDGYPSDDFGTVYCFTPGAGQ